MRTEGAELNQLSKPLCLAVKTQQPHVEPIHNVSISSKNEELLTLFVSSSAGTTYHQKGDGGGGRVRTDDLRLAKPSLSQLSYAPE